MRQYSSNIHRDFVLIFLLFIGSILSSFGQEKDSLLNKINSESAPVSKVELINEFIDKFNDNSEFVWDLLDQALTISEEIRNDSLKISVLSRMGFTTLSSGDYEKAQKIYHEAALLAHQTGDSLEFYWAENSRGLVNYYLENYKQAEEIYLSLENYISGINDTAVIAGFYNNLGMIYNMLEDYDKALANYSRAYELKKIINSPDLLNTLNNLADTYFRIDSLEKSEELFREFYTLAYKTESVMYQTVADLSLGSVMLHKGQPKAGLKLLLEALNKSRKYKYKEFEFTVLNDISEAYSRLGQFEKAFENQKLSRELEDSLNSLERQKNLNELETRFNTKLKESQIESLKIQEVKSQKIISLQKLVIFSSIIALIIIAALLFIQFRLNKTIANQKNELISLNQNKDRFFSIIAHDLRSPFNSILGMLDLLSEKDNKMSKAEIEKHILTLEKTANSTFNLLQNLLNWARSQMDNLQLNIEKLSISEIIHEQSRILSAQASEKNINLEIDEIGDSSVTADRDMLSFVVRNIISNSLKFTHSGNRIMVRTREEAKFLCIEIEDQGIGMPPQLIPLLFEIGVEKSRAGTNGEKGSGLGLPLCKIFTEKMSGEFKITSILAQGTRVEIYIPLSSKEK